MPTIVGLDMSLTSSGVARVSTGDALGVVVELHRILSKPPPKDRVTIYSRSKRLRTIAHQAFTYCTGADLVVIEGPSYASDSGAAHDRAACWWLVVARLTAQGINVVEVPPTVLKTYATGKGNAGKDQVLAAIIRRHPSVEVDGNDAADALTLASMGARFVGHPIDGDLPQTHLRGMARVRWEPNR